MAKFRILIIEDDTEVRDLLSILLSRAGYEISVASDGIEGIHAYRTDPADLIITDLVMPGKEGLETIVDLRREFPDLKIIAISGGGLDGQSNYLNAARLCGATMTFRKPFKNQEIVDAVDGLLTKKNSSES
jgi:DNA-binding response OmpR family regulator